VTAAKLVGRDVKAVHTDTTALVKAGTLKQEDKGVEFPLLIDKSGIYSEAIGAAQGAEDRGRSTGRAHD
jgi:hypothetical protein